MHRLRNCVLCLGGVLLSVEAWVALPTALRGTGSLAVGDRSQLAPVCTKLTGEVLDAGAPEEEEEAARPPPESAQPVVADVKLEGESDLFQPEERRLGPASLTSETQWRLFLSLHAPGQEGSRKTEVAVRVRFLEDEGYEPPQGRLEVLEANPLLPPQEGQRAGRWTLSEDPGERKGGLWVWGLLKEPQYPFLLLQMDNREVPLNGGGMISKGQLFLKLDHVREEERGVTLDSGVVGVREVQRVQVDAVGLADAEIAEVVPCGSVRLRALSLFG